LKRIIITGGSGGIGYYLSTAFLSDNYHITVVGRSKSKFVSTLGKAIAVDKIDFFPVDIVSQTAVNDFYSKFKLDSTSFLGLINAAGIQAPIGEFTDNETGEWERNIAVNLFGTANMIRAALPLFKSLGGGKIINFSGGGATGPRPRFSAYAISKTAVVRLTEILSIELNKYSIEINAVAPGAINTSMLDEIINAGVTAGPEYDLAIERKLKGGANPEQIVKLCRFLMSPDSTGVTGRLLSAVWDDFTNDKFLLRLKTDSDFCCLRRIDSNNFDIVQ